MKLTICFWLLLFASIFFVSCANPKPNATGFGVGRISAYTDIALNANPQPQVVKDSLKGIQLELPIVKGIIEADAAIISDQQVEIAKKDFKLLEYKNQWVGDRAWFYGKWILGIWIVGSILGSILVTATGGVGVLGIIGKNLVWLMPFANPFRWITALVGMWGKNA